MAIGNEARMEMAAGSEEELEALVAWPVLQEIKKRRQDLRTDRDRTDGKIDGLRQDTGDEIDSLRRDMTDKVDELAGDMKEEFPNVRQEMKEGFAAVHSDTLPVQEPLPGTIGNPREFFRLPRFRPSRWAGPPLPAAD